MHLGNGTSRHPTSFTRMDASSLQSHSGVCKAELNTTLLCLYAGALASTPPGTATPKYRHATSTSQRPSFSRKVHCARNADCRAQPANSRVGTVARRLHSGAGMPRWTMLLHNGATTSWRTHSVLSMRHSNATLLVLKIGACKSHWPSETAAPTYLNMSTGKPTTTELILKRWVPACDVQPVVAETLSDETNFPLCCRTCHVLQALHAPTACVRAHGLARDACKSLTAQKAAASTLPIEQTRIYL